MKYLPFYLSNQTKNTKIISLRMMSFLNIVRLSLLLPASVAFITSSSTLKISEIDPAIFTTTLGQRSSPASTLSSVSSPSSISESDNSRLDLVDLETLASVLGVATEAAKKAGDIVQDPRDWFKALLVEAPA